MGFHGIGCCHARFTVPFSWQQKAWLPKFRDAVHLMWGRTLVLFEMEQTFFYADVSIAILSIQFSKFKFSYS